MKDDLAQKSSILNYQSAVIVGIIIFAIYIFAHALPKITRSMTADVAIGATVMVTTKPSESPFDNNIMPRIATTKESYKNMREKTIFDDKIIDIEPWTEAVVLDKGLEEFLIEIQSGVHEGEQGWIYYEFVEVEK